MSYIHRRLRKYCVLSVAVLDTYTREIVKAVLDNNHSLHSTFCINDCLLGEGSKVFFFWDFTVFTLCISRDIWDEQLKGKAQRPTYRNIYIFFLNHARVIEFKTILVNAADRDFGGKKWNCSVSRAAAYKVDMYWGQLKS